ncbi:PTS system trehalose-specific EIIBC component [Clostridium saccharoperbutylacetonicum]|uniref:PTS system trehalose-specific EIIBC component n=1 Tax=Clostridium saccharoperbutylacetonicum TaxID=36745 RepID=UPI000983B6D7|nr:PTS system trehalose-specific EIIBC component [Clostridium saccharoperbutylacetonicum]AQR94909.1 PTS system trehalose-specific EIIBC component [Clostridium saccharoperbutylacetonicum]NSB30751.1 PTS system trehalose-specific IIC component [Clostridium saccharoperbutylacetonicum]
MGKFENDSKELLKYVGGKENISAVTHCVTRMRFVLNDPSKADKEAIEKLKSVKGTFTQAGQFQVVIGNEVSVFYNDFIKVSGIDGVSKDEVKNVAKNNMTFIQKLMANIAEIFSPLIPAIIVGGLILGFRNIIGDMKLLEGGTRSLVEVSQFWAGTNSFLWLIGEAIFHFLPVGITWSITKKMGTTQILGIVLGITLVSPQLLNAYAVAGTPADKIPFWNFGFAQVKMIGYQAQVIPAILAGFTLVFLERGARKISPASISMIVVPFLALVPAVLIAHIVIGPIGWVIGSGISQVVYGGLTSSFGAIFAAIFGFLYAPLVITGLHHMTNAIDLQLMAQFNGTSLWPMIALSNIAQGSAVLAMIYLQRKNEEAQEINVPACISAYLGVTEPAMFGVNLKYSFPFLCGMTGSAIAAIISVGSGVMANSIGVGGLPGILSIKPAFMMTFAICMVVAIVIPFVLTVIVGKKKGIK